MATTARQQKTTRKGPPEPARRSPAWSTNARSSPTFTPPPTTTSPRPTNPATPVAGFPPLGQTNGARQEDRILQPLSGLTGTTITLLTKTSQRYEGVISSTSSEGDTTGVTLKDVKEISAPGTATKDLLFIATTNIDSWTSGPADAKLTNGDSFRTDTDISQKKAGTREGRELQAWHPSSDGSAPPSGAGHLDDETFGAGASGNNTSWDQFAANEELFGVKATFDESQYTTKLDRNRPDFKELERKAAKIASEINGASTNNPHIAEERNQIVDDSGVNEEDKYGAVVRGQNAYVPPGARKTGAPVAAPGVKSDLPKVSVNGPDGASVTAPAQSSGSSSKAPSPAPSNKPPADPIPAFRDFVTNERQRLTQKRQALQKSEMDKRMADLVKFSQSFKLNKPIPDDLVPILAKDEEKQKAIKEKSTKDAASGQARNIGPATSTNAINPRAPPGSKDAVRKPSVPASGAKTTNNVTNPPVTGTSTPKAATNKPTPADAAAAAAAKKKAAMFIQAIPPFKGAKARQSQQPAPNGAAPTTPTDGKPPGTPKSAANRLNVNASSFRPNPQASAFTPGAPSPGASGTSSVSPKPRESQTPSTPNPFFGTRPIKKTAVNIKDDFNPFKHNKVAEASAVAAVWPYNGKRYSHIFPQSQHPPNQHSPHMGPPMPPPMPPPSYEEDSAAQAAAARGYVYYPPYGYAQPIMPGMPPPQGFMPGPYMQPMPYPPGMPPNVMYAPPPMGQMPPPQAYMTGPPPGTYPPNGAQGPPRPSMPPTPIPSHAHPYYQQSPQLQHAVPYPMMMPPPNGGPPHGYEGGPPPQQMSGHA